MMCFFFSLAIQSSRTSKNRSRDGLPEFAAGWKVEDLLFLWESVSSEKQSCLFSTFACNTYFFFRGYYIIEFLCIGIIISHYKDLYEPISTMEGSSFMKKCWVFEHGIAMKIQSWLSCWCDSGTVFATGESWEGFRMWYQGVSRSACSPTKFPTPLPNWKSQFIDSPFHGDMFSWGYQSKKFGKVHCEGGIDGKKPEANRVTVCHIRLKILEFFNFVLWKVLYFSHHFLVR